MQPTLWKRLSFVAGLCLGIGVDAPATDSAALLLTDEGVEGSDSFLFWMDNSLKLTPYGWGYAIDPGEQSNLTFEHAHESQIGDLYLFLDVAYLHNTSSGAD